MAIFPYQFINTRGIPTIESTGVTISTTDVVFSFKSHAGRNTHFRGLLLVKLNQELPAGVDPALPIKFTSEFGGTKEITLAGGSVVTAEQYPGPGVYLFYYDRFADVLQVLTY